MADEKAGKRETNASESAAIGSAPSLWPTLYQRFRILELTPMRSISPASGLVLAGNSAARHLGDCSRITLVFYRKRALESGDGRTLWRAFVKTVRRKPLAGAADAAYGFSIDFRLEIVARSGIRQKRCY